MSTAITDEAMRQVKQIGGQQCVDGWSEDALGRAELQALSTSSRPRPVVGNMIDTPGLQQHLYLRRAGGGTRQGN